jgi:hypothetical protein
LCCRYQPTGTSHQPARESGGDFVHILSGADYLITHGAEAADVTIRCYLLGECIAAALEEIKDDFNEAHEGEEDEEE